MTRIAVKTPKSKVYKGKERTEPWAWLCLMPVIVLFAVFEFYPLIGAVVLSTQKTDQFGRARGFDGLQNYITLFSDPEFTGTLWRTMVFTVFSVLGKIIIGLAIALPLSYRIRGTVWMRSVILIPMAVSTAVGTLVFKQMFAPSVGFFDQIAHALGFGSVGWVTAPEVAMISVLIIDIWMGIAFVVLLMLVSIDGISNEVVEAANLDGATGLRYIRHIIIPGISHMLLFIAITQSIAAMKEFTILQVLADGGPGNSTTTLVLDLYHKAFADGTGDFAAASARGVVLFIFVLLLTLVQFRISRKRGEKL